jgi:GNAT superfamily N-acetyltransferase
MGTGAETEVVVTRRGHSVSVGPLRDAERGALFALFEDVVASGDGYPHASPLTQETFDDTWIRPVTTVVAARVRGELWGAYYLKPNFVGRGAHIANAGYVVAAEHRRQGIGRVLVEDSIRRAPLFWFDAVQFNLVFVSNPARALYEDLGWAEIGRIPDAVCGEEAIIYWRRVG